MFYKLQKDGWKQVKDLMAPSLRKLLHGLNADLTSKLEEVRLRAERPLVIKLHNKEVWITSQGEAAAPEQMGKAEDLQDVFYIVTADEIAQSLQLMSAYSVYALEEEFRQGFLTLPGGHRVGLSGRVNMDNHSLKSIHPVTSLNIRLARQVWGAADKIISNLIDSERGHFYSTLIVSPPRCGKTTLLRDLVRQLSTGNPAVGWTGVDVGVVDERTEIAACYRGVPQNDVGLRTDVLDGCPKAEGIIRLLRSMAPRIIATDELGKWEDANAVEDALHAGVSVLATVHGHNWQDVRKRPLFQRLIKVSAFEKVVVLGRSRGVGTIEEIIELQKGESEKERLTQAKGLKRQALSQVMAVKTVNELSHPEPEPLIRWPKRNDISQSK